MADYAVTSSSTCDLNENQIKEYGISIIPLKVLLGGKDYFDNVDIKTVDILQYVDKGGDLPKTSAISIEEYKEFFKTFVDQGKKVIHFDISSELSSCHSNASIAAKEIGNVFVIDSCQLSSGQGLLVLKASDMLKAGKTVEETYETICAIAPKVQTSFVLDRLDFLHKGGRCSLTQLLGAKFLKLHPCLYMNEGFLKIKKKYPGNLKRCLESYITDLSLEFHNYDKKRCFITHCEAEQQFIDVAVAKVKELFDFEEVIVSKAGCTVCSHCGKNTLGVLFVCE